MECPSCGSNDIETRKEERYVQAVLGARVPYTAVVNLCAACGMDGDFNAVNDPPLEDALKASDQLALAVWVDVIERAGFRKPAIERILGIPPGTIKHWVEHPETVTPEGTALLKLLVLWPDILSALDCPRV